MCKFEPLIPMLKAKLFSIKPKFCKQRQCFY